MEVDERHIIDQESVASSVEAHGRRRLPCASGTGYGNQHTVDVHGSCMEAQLAALEGSERTQRAVDQLLTISRREDRRQFDRYAEYIKMRLRQIAFERSNGSYTAYARAVVPSRPDILYASRVLRESE